MYIPWVEHFHAITFFDLILDPVTPDDLGEVMVFHQQILDLFSVLSTPVFHVTSV